jgi:hypothetical protein
MIVFGEEFHDGTIRFINVFFVSRQRHPAERSLTLAEQGTDIGWHKTGELERITHAVVISLLTDIVSIIEDF